ncbi:GGDEF domain-containing protein [Shewanella maritima]|uniref:GGDEF domain-containing protein n=1 Tax=Shewanella maritima TaxID=2520507 RepID=UPI0013EECE31|nr:sensor domain-containing diguanylate cyclase [Shewanella maritima]
MQKTEIIKTLQADPNFDEANINELLYQSNRDIAKRSSTGSYIYLLIWFALVLPSNLWQVNSNLSIIVTCAFLLLACLRLPYVFKFDSIYLKFPGVWRYGFPLIVLSPALMWGTLCSLCFVIPKLEPYALIIIISTAGLTGGGVAALIPSRFLTIGLFSAFLVPPFITLVVTQHENVSLTLVFAIYWLGMYSTTNEQHAQYWKALKDSLFIKNHAKELEHLNNMDELSGLKNKRYFNKALMQNVKLAARASGPLAVMLLDIDNFKQINDKYGHLVGDVSIHKLGEVLKSIVKRDTDVVARFGGDEFAIILPSQDKQRCVEIGESICRAVASLNPSSPETSLVDQSPQVKFTVSIGLCFSMPTSSTHHNDLVEQADHALYEAKHQGKNRVVVVDNH